MTTRWTIGIDWDRDGSYTDETACDLSAKWMLGFQQAFMDVGNDAKLTRLMRNEDKRFTPENRIGFAKYNSPYVKRPYMWFSSILSSRSVSGVSRAGGF